MILCMWNASCVYDTHIVQITFKVLRRYMYIPHLLVQFEKTTITTLTLTSVYYYINPHTVY